MELEFKLYNRGYNLMVECHASDLIVRVRFPLAAPKKYFKINCKRLIFLHFISKNQEIFYIILTNYVKCDIIITRKKFLKKGSPLLWGRR